VFVHGGLGDYRDSDACTAPLAKHYRVIVYSRRYNFPNQNEAQPDHSAVVEADDLAALLKELNIDQAHLIGHSYGAYTILFLAIKHPELVRSLTLAEPPVHRWASDSPEGKQVFKDMMEFWGKAGDAFRKGNSDEALRLMAAFFSENKETYESLPAVVRKKTEQNLKEWKALTTSRDAYPPVERRLVEKIKKPVLILCGEKTLRIHQLVNSVLERLLKGNKDTERFTVLGAGHDMWGEQPEVCRKVVLEFLSKH
jgi:pimeloyl-ACP methyl ester carboxylesterase